MLRKSKKVPCLLPMKPTTQLRVQMLGQSEQDNAIEVLKLATERFSKSASAWDSLGEAYAIKGDQKNAIPCFKKSLGLSPPENVKINSKKYLKHFGAF